MLRIISLSSDYLCVLVQVFAQLCNYMIRFLLKNKENYRKLLNNYGF